MLPFCEPQQCSSTLDMDSCLYNRWARLQYRSLLRIIISMATFEIAKFICSKPTLIQQVNKSQLRLTEFVTFFLSRIDISAYEIRPRTCPNVLILPYEKSFLKNKFFENGISKCREKCNQMFLNGLSNELFYNLSSLHKRKRTVLNRTKELNNLISNWVKVLRW